MPEVRCLSNAPAARATWGSGLDIIVDPYSGSSSGRVTVTTFLSCDVAVRQPVSFCVGRDAA